MQKQWKMSRCFCFGVENTRLSVFPIVRLIQIKNK